MTTRRDFTVIKNLKDFIREYAANPLGYPAEVQEVMIAFYSIKGKTLWNGTECRILSKALNQLGVS